MPTAKNYKAVATNATGKTASLANVYLFKKNDLSLVRLKWNFKGIKFHTLCLVSKKQGVIYDNLLYFIQFVSKATKQTQRKASKRSQAHRLKSSSKRSIPDGTPISHTYSKSLQASNIFGKLHYSYTIFCRVNGTVVHGKKSITGKKLRAHAAHAPGYDATAKIHTNSFKKGPSGQLGWRYSTSFGTIAGGSGASGGSEYVSASQLVTKTNGIIQPVQRYGSNREKINIFEFGKPLTGCKSNFENLFHNWALFVSNSQHTKLISYHYVKTLMDSSQISRYARLANNRNSLLASGSSSASFKGEIIGGDTAWVSTRKVLFYPKTLQQALADSNTGMPKFLKDFYRRNLGNMIKIERYNFKHKVQSGDKVYVIKLETGGKKYNHYAVCRPSGNNIVYDNLFLHIVGVKRRTH